MSLKWKPRDSTLFLISGTEASKLELMRMRPARRGDEIGAEVLAADVIEISGDAEGRKRSQPCRIVLGGEREAAEARNANRARRKAN